MPIRGFGLNLGGFFGSLVICPFAKRYGRIKSFYIGQAMMILGCCLVILMKLCTAEFEVNIQAVYVLGRVIKGIACGINSVIVPLYSKVYIVRETAPLELAGGLVSLHPIMKSMGIFCSVFLFTWISDGIPHNLLHLVPIFLCILQFILFQRYFNYESPSYLWLSNRRNEAIYQINRLYFNESMIRSTVFTKLAILHNNSR
jgi:MFS family permease